MGTAGGAGQEPVRCAEQPWPMEGGSHDELLSPAPFS